MSLEMEAFIFKEIAKLYTKGLLMLYFQSKDIKEKKGYTDPNEIERVLKKVAAGRQRFCYKHMFAALKDEALRNNLMLTVEKISESSHMYSLYNTLTGELIK